jgi:hypothetical protein
MGGYMPLEFNAHDCDIVQAETTIWMLNSYQNFRYQSKITTDNGVKLVNGLAYGDLRNVTPIYITAHKQEPSDTVRLDSIYVEIFNQ